MKRLSYADLSTRLSQAEHDRGLLMLALQYSTVDDPDVKTFARDGDWSYHVRAYALTAAHGGIVVIRARCHSNKQRDSVTAYYLDHAGDRFPFDQTPNLHARIREIRNVRHNVLFPVQEVTS